MLFPFLHTALARPLVVGLLKQHREEGQDVAVPSTKAGQQQLTSAEKSPWCRSSRVSPDLVEYGISWSPRCRAITVT